MFAMENDFQVRCIPIDGLGHQMHIAYTTPPIRNIVSVMEAVDQRGFKIHISEMDVRVNPQGFSLCLRMSRASFRRSV